MSPSKYRKALCAAAPSAAVAPVGDAKGEREVGEACALTTTAVDDEDDADGNEDEDDAASFFLLAWLDAAAAAAGAAPAVPAAAGDGLQAARAARSRLGRLARSRTRLVRGRQAAAGRRQAGIFP